MRAFIKFNKGIMKMPMLMQLWLMLLMVVNLVVALFFQPPGGPGRGDHLSGELHPDAFVDLPF